MSDRLDSGMTKREAVDRAAAWWNATGRQLIKFAKVDPVMVGLSGMLRGDEFDQLSEREQGRVVQVWHHFKIRRADVLDVDPDARFLLGGEEQIH